MKNVNISEEATNHQRVPEGFSPAPNRNDTGQHPAEDKGQWEEVPILESHHRILFQIGQVDCATFFDHRRMFGAHEPAHVGEEESPFGVVWIGIGLRVLVMDSVVTTPHEDTVLHGHRLQQHQQNPQREPGLVGSMRP